ncbi:hypothetical protein [Spiroplasma endosymbiont of Othius punctulatus]|uniref:oxidoreductase n=1 Tax=Spiroplasma endosymbiont of Othius punctulatus TaxID=3066289 RepID=UPI0030D1D072
MYKINDKTELIKGIKSRNRIVMPPMDTLMATDGFVNDFHIQHYGARAYGGIGTIIIESTAVSSEGRIRQNDLGLWKDEQIEGYKRIALLAHQAGSIIGAQLNHAGAKAELEELTMGTTNFYSYLDQKNFRLTTEKDLQRIENDFVKASMRAKTSGLDFVELHAAHGYLLNEILHPTLNEINKQNNMVDRSKMIIEILKRIKEEVDIPVGIRLSVSDDLNSSKLKIEDFKPFIEAIEEYVDYFHISSGSTIGARNQVEITPKPTTKMFRIPYAEQVMKWTKKNVITVGNYNTIEDINYALSKNIPYIAIGREALYNPNLLINSLLTSDQMSDEDYHWNKNPWFNPKQYTKLMEEIKSKSKK